MDYEEDHMNKRKQVFKFKAAVEGYSGNGFGL